MINKIHIPPSDPLFRVVLNERLEQISTALESAGVTDTGSAAAEARIGTHAQRLALAARDVDEGTLYYETDLGLLYVTAGSPERQWVYITPSDVQAAYCGTLLILTTTPTDVPDCSLTLTRAGVYLVTAAFQMAGSGAGDDGEALLGYLMADGSLQAQTTYFVAVAGASGGCSAQTWIHTAADPGEVVKLQAEKSGGSGGSFVAENTSIVAQWIRP
jgi:hypothetical protein